MAVGAGAERADPFQHRAARRRDDLPGQLVERFEAELGHHRGETLAAGLVACRQRVQVALRHVRLAHVRPHHPHQRAVDLACADEVADRDADALLEDLVGVGAEAASAHVGDVAGGREQRDQAAVQERRGDDREVVEVSRALPGVVGDEHVALAQGIDRVVAQEAAHGGRHGVDVPGSPRDRLRQHAPLQVEDARREVARLAHRS